MRNSASRVERAYSARRRTVRIVRPRRATRSAAVSLLMVVAPAMLLFLVWRFWEKDEEMPIVRRRPEEVVLDWKCESRHTFKARGQAGPRKCPRCRKPAYAVGAYDCQVHGTFEVAIRHAQDAAGIIRPSDYRIAGGNWIPAVNGARCPRCDLPLTRRPKDPFAERKPRRKRRSGR